MKNGTKKRRKKVGADRAEKNSSSKEKTFNKACFRALFDLSDDRGGPTPGDDEIPQGWSKNAPCPMEYLARFPHLRIKEGFVLRNYLYSECGGRHSAVFAMPAGAPFPEPSECPIRREDDLDSPMPRDAIADYMNVVEGDETPETYLSASVFARGVADLGSAWHGVGWSAYTVLFGDPFARELGGTERDLHRLHSRHWEWKKLGPRDWGPIVDFVEDTTTVVFHTYTSSGAELLSRHTDRFENKSLCYSTEVEVLAIGPDGRIC